MFVYITSKESGTRWYLAAIVEDVFWVLEAVGGIILHPTS